MVSALLLATFGVAAGASVDGGSADVAVANATDSAQEDGIDLRSIELGETAEGEIDEGDPESEQYRGHYEPVTFQGEMGQVVTIDMESDGDTYLILEGPDGEELVRDDDGGLGFDSRIEDFELPANGEYTIIATSYSSFDTFEYTLELSRGEASDDTTPTEGPGSDGLDLRSIELGETAEGEIDDADPESDENRGHYEPVTFQGELGQVVTIDMESDDDTYLILRGPDGEELVRDDDGGSGLDSRIENFELPANGEYTIVATSYSSFDTFEYTLSLQEGSDGIGGDGDGVDLRAIEFGQTAEGELDTGDPSSTDNRGRHEPVTFGGEAGQVVTITMRSEPGDTYLILRGPDGDEIARNDDSFDVEGSLNSRIENVRLPETGEYTIVATSYTEMDTFPYTLTLEEGSGGDSVFEPDQFEPNENCAGATRAEIGASYDDLNIGSNIDEDYFAVQLDRGEGITASIDFSHSEGDIDMSLEGPGSGFSLDSSISVSDGETVSTVADTTGTYCIRVYGYSGATAEYDLDIEAGADEDDDFGGEDGGASGADLRSIELGQTVSGSIDSEDPESDANRGTYEPVTFQGEAGQVVSIDMESDVGDTYLILQGPSGEVLAENDDGGAGLNSRIDSVELPSNGEYTIVATSFWDGSTFDYTLSLQAGGTGGDGDIGQSETTDLTVPPVQATPGGSVEVTYELRNTADETRAFVLRSGLTGLPAGWEVTGHEDAGGTWRGDDRTWLFQEVGAEGEVSPSVTLEVPDDVSTGETFSFRASALTQDGSQGVRGTGTVTIEIRETTLAQAVDQNDDGEIGDIEILTAIEWWQNEEEVPGYGDTISDLQILDLIGMWQDDESVGGN